MDSNDGQDPIFRRTIGFLISKNRRGVTVAMEDDREADIDGKDCQTVTTIPMKMVKKVVPLDEPAAENGKEHVLELA